MKRWLTAALVLALLAAVASSARAQGVQTGVLTGTLTSADGLSLPGATVSVTAPTLQGVRTATTEPDGAWVLRGLPPGTYTVVFEMDGMQSRTQTVELPLARTVVVDAVLQIGTITEQVTVSGAGSPVLTSPTTSANITAHEVNVMPIGRTPFLIGELAPGLTDNGPNAGQLTIAGAFAYDNVFLVDGVDINDNVFGTSHNLFIEDAIQETQVLTSGISAEFGRFSGGVVNAVTKRGGDAFSGSARLNLSNPAWSDETPFEDTNGTTRASKLAKTWEGTFGGPVVRTRLWFFGAGRYERSQQTNSLRETGIPYEQGLENNRYDVKLTGTIWKQHTFQGGYINNDRSDSSRPGLAGAVDPRSLVTRELPNRLFVTSWNGILSPTMFATAQYSQKSFGFRNDGGTSTAIADSPFRSRGILGIPSALLYNAPFFDATDPEDRNNRQVAGSLSWFTSPPRLGRHDIKGGFEVFRSNRTGGNSQTSTGYVFLSDYVVDAAGKPALDAQGRLIPRFVPGVSQVQNWLATRGAEINITTTSLYLQDRWVASPRLTLDLGLRYERASGEATGDIVTADTSSLVPRLGATFDATGSGRFIVQGTYSHYAGKYSDVQFARNTNVGSPTRITYAYTGPEGQGMDFAPGITIANYPTVVSGNFPTANVFLDPDLKSPLTREVSLSTGAELSRNAHVKATYVWRSTDRFIDDFIELENGTTTIVRNGVNFGTFDNVVYRNTDEPRRDYQGLILQGRYRVTPRLEFSGHWTVQLKNEGNFEGEAASQPGNPTLFHDAPGVFSPERNYPVGRFDDFQRHKVRLWTNYQLGLGRFGSVDLSGVWRYNSALTYSLIATNVALTPQQRAAAAGFARLPNSGVQNLFFGERGAEEFAGYGLVDLSAHVAVPVWRSVRPWVKVEVLNALNNQKLIGWDTTITPDATGPRDAFGLPLDYVTGARYGQATRNADYPRWRPGFDGGRTFLVAAGLRF